MSIVGGIIQAPVTVDDVKQVLGVSNNDVGYLCSNSHGKINPWAKYKPVNFNGKIGILTETELRSTIYGLTYKKFQDFREAIIYVWEYAPPSGGASWPYRLHDFVNYYHGAPAPVEKNTSYTFNTNLVSRITVYLNLHSLSSGGVILTANDILYPLIEKEGKDYYCAILLTNGTLWWIKTNTDRIVQGGSWYDIPLYNSDPPFTGNGNITYDYYFILVDRIYPDMVSISATEQNTYIPFPYTTHLDNVGKIYKTFTSSLSIELIGVSSNYDIRTMVTQKFDNPEKYEYLSSSEYQEWFPVDATGNMAFKLRITNIGNQPVAYHVNSFWVDLDPGMNYLGLVTNKVTYYVYDANTGDRVTGNSATNNLIQVNGNSSMEIVLARQSGLILVRRSDGLEDEYAMIGQGIGVVGLGVKIGNYGFSGGGSGNIGQQFEQNFNGICMKRRN